MKDFATMNMLSDSQIAKLMPLAKELSSAQMAAHKARGALIDALLEMANGDATSDCAILANRLAITEHQHQAIHLAESEIGMAIGWPLPLARGR